MSPRTRAAIEKIKQEKRELILNGALELFAINGYHITTVAAIAQKVKISKGLIYTYFKSKEEIITTLICDSMEDLLKKMLPEDGGDLTDDDFLKLIKLNFKWVKDNHIFFKMYMAVVQQPTVFKLVEKRIMEIAQPVFVKTNNYFASKGFDDPYAETRYFNSLLDGINMNFIMEPGTFPIDALEKKVIAQYSNLIKNHNHE